MRNAIKWFGIIALIAVIGFSFGACGGGSDTGSDTSSDNSSDTGGGDTAVTFSGLTANGSATETTTALTRLLARQLPAFPQATLV
jgi:ABC-type glycerol-3-phosphate transport system substrate-binding protein